MSDTRKNRTVRLQIRCLSPWPAEYQGQPAEFGLQDDAEKLHDGQALPEGVRLFKTSATVKARKGTGEPDFNGSFIHGKPGERFLYLGWRIEGQKNWIRRAKIMMETITWAVLDEAERIPNGGLAAEITSLEKTRPPLQGGGWIAEELIDD